MDYEDTAAVTVDAIRAALATAGFVEYDGGQFGFRVTKAAFTDDFIVDLRGVNLLPFNPGEGPRALLDDYVAALTVAGYRVRTPGSMVIVSETPADAGDEPPVAECSYCTTRITLLGGQWTADDGTSCCTDQSAPYVPHKPKED